MVVLEDKRYSAEYHEPDKRSIANAIEVFFTDGESSGKVEVEYPIGHRRRRQEGFPVLVSKFKSNLLTCFSAARSDAIFKVCDKQKELELMSVNEFMDLLVK